MVDRIVFLWLDIALAPRIRQYHHSLLVPHPQIPIVAPCPLCITFAIILYSFARCCQIATDSQLEMWHVNKILHIHPLFLSCFTRTFFSESWSPTRRTLAIRSASWRSPTAMLHQNPWSYASTLTRRGWFADDCCIYNIGQISDRWYVMLFCLMFSATLFRYNLAGWQDTHDWGEGMECVGVCVCVWHGYGLPCCSQIHNMSIWIHLNL